jgi:hypothetical protein
MLEKGPCPVFIVLLIIEIVIKIKLIIVIIAAVILVTFSDIKTFFLISDFFLKKTMVRIIWTTDNIIDRPRLTRPELKLNISRFIFYFLY